LISLPFAAMPHIDITLSPPLRCHILISYASIIDYCLAISGCHIAIVDAAFTPLITAAIFAITPLFRHYARRCRQRCCHFDRLTAIYCRRLSIAAITDARCAADITPLMPLL
jgi:hypothetical protein